MTKTTNNSSFISSKNLAPKLNINALTRECTIYKHDAIVVFADALSIFSETPSDSFVFLYNGCITTESNDFAQKATRVHWTENTDLYAEDQFYLQFDLAGDSEYKVRLIFCE